MIQRLHRDERGASAAEFGLVLPILLLFLLGIIDAGRLLWEWNRAEKATQMGVRYAVVTDVVASELASYNFVGKTVTVGTTSRTLTQGDIIPREALGSIACTNVSCVCTSCPAGLGVTRNNTAFTNIVQRMQAFKSDVSAADVQVSYSGSGLGFAGDPTGMDISPIVTVRLRNLQFSPIFLFGQIAISLPAFESTLTAEDGRGTVSN
jgi:Flp pilus assembly protein TadG